MCIRDSFSGKAKLQQMMSAGRESVARARGQSSAAAADSPRSAAAPAGPEDDVNRTEFILQMLVVLGQIEREDVLDLNDLFNALDITGDGTLNRDDIDEFMRLKDARIRDKARQGALLAAPTGAGSEVL